MGRRRSALWPPGTGECWPAVTAGYSRVRRLGRAPGCASAGRSRMRHLHSGAAVRLRPARVLVVAVRAGGRAARDRCGPPRAETGGHPRAGTPFDPAVPRSGSASVQAAAVRAESPACRRRCSQQHHAPPLPLTHRRGLKPPEPAAVGAGAQAPGPRPSGQSPGSVAAPVTTRPPPPGPLARGRRVDDDLAWTGSARRAGRRP